MLHLTDAVSRTRSSVKASSLHGRWISCDTQCVLHDWPNFLVAETKAIHLAAFSLLELVVEWIFGWLSYVLPPLSPSFCFSIIFACVSFLNPRQLLYNINSSEYHALHEKICINCVTNWWCFLTKIIFRQVGKFFDDAKKKLLCIEMRMDKSKRQSFICLIQNFELGAAHSCPFMWPIQP